MINKFSGQYRFLSNFWPVQVELDNEIYPSVEHAYQASKTLNPIERQAIRKSNSPRAAKRLGRQVTLRPDWEEIKYDMMYYLVKQKFKVPALHKLLSSTSPHTLEEGNTWGDKIWGTVNGVGQNWLGRILMHVRDENAVNEA